MAARARNEMEPGLKDFPDRHGCIVLPQPQEINEGRQEERITRYAGGSACISCCWECEVVTMQGIPTTCNTIGRGLWNGCYKNNFESWCEDISRRLTHGNERKKQNGEIVETLRKVDILI